MSTEDVESMGEETTKHTIMTIVAHPDDEIDSAGTMANHVDKGDDVHLVFLTKGENITNMDGTPEEIIARRKTHTAKIENLLGVTVHFMDFPDSKIEVNVEGGYKVARMIKKIKPDVIITWNENGGNEHPDHVNTYHLVMKAITYCRLQDSGSDLEPHRKNMNVYVYKPFREEPTQAMVYVDVTSQYQKILEFIEIYKEAYGFPHMDFFISHVLTANGLRKGVRYAECFVLKAGITAPFDALPVHPGIDKLRESLIEEKQ